MEWLSTAWSFVRKGSAPLAVAVATVSAAVLWVPQVSALGSTEWRPRAVLAFLASAVLVLSHAFEWVRSRLRDAAGMRGRRALLREFPPEAKAVIGALFQHEVLRMDYRDATVSLLCAADVLYHPSVSHGGFRFDFTLQPWVRGLLRKHPDLLEGAAPALNVRVYDRAVPWWEA